MASQTTFRPFVPANESRKELSVRALVLGGFFGIIFGAVTVYVGLRAGLTVAASIPISVLSISVLRYAIIFLRKMGLPIDRESILENNIVQTTGNAGQSIASGVIFTLPALIFLGFDLESFRIFALALFGGWLGVLFMIPLRRQLIVEEHGTLIYPEGTACADVLQAGERGGSFASRVFLGLGIGGLYTLFQNGSLLSLFPSTPNQNFNLDPNGQQILKGAAIRADVTPEYLGVGYVIGIRIAAVMLAGGVFSWLVLMPAIVFFGKHMGTPLYPGTIPIAQMDPSALWITYVRPMGAGAVAASGLITLLRTAPTIVNALAGSFKKKTPAQAQTEAALDARAESPAGPPRTEQDLPVSVIVVGSLLLLVMIVVFLQFKPVPGAQVGLLANIAASLLVLVFGFLFVTVSARIVGIVGSSSSPVSGMTIATLMATAAIFLVKGWTAPAFGALAITIGGMVCIAASNAGDTSQDLKTGYLIGATPWKQQVALMIGVVISTFSIGWTLNAMNKGLESFQKMPVARTVSLAALPDGVSNQGTFARDHVSLTIKSSSGAVSHADMPNTNHFLLLNSIGSTTLEDGKYLYNPATGQIEVQWIQGIGSENAAAPQGRLMATVINGILSRKLPWSLVLLGVMLVLCVELLGIRSLTFAVGAYLSIGTTLAIFCGGVVRWMVDRATKRSDEGHDELSEEVSPGSLYASGLIAAGGIMGLVGVCVKLYETATDKSIWRFPDTNFFHKDIVSVVAFLALAFSLYHFARKPLANKEN
ncbi:MAG TPA: oligopeptide transporter, OPT family [Acidobacteriaceae bacterium]|jgi:putative OPT family oligopeptide transporter